MATATPTIDPVLVTLASAFRLTVIDDACACRAIDRAVDHLSSGLAYEFDGVELRIQSYSRRDQGCIQVTDGIGCTCESARRPWCWHRAAARLLLAVMAFREPNVLRAKIIEQVAPADILEANEDGAFDEYGDFLDQPFHEITPAAGSRWAAAQDAADSLFN